MLQELAGKWPDIVIALMTGMVTGLVCLLIDRATKRTEPAAERPVTLKHVTRVSVDIVAHQPKPTGIDPRLAAVAVVVASIAYLRNQDLVWTAALWFSTGLLGLWFAVLAYSLVAGHIDGLTWPTYLLSMMAALTIGTLSILSAAASPAVLPAVQLPFEQWQAFALEYGARRLFVFLGPQGVGWLAAHVLGMALFFLSLRQAALSMVFYAAAGSGRLQRADESSWFARVGAAYARPLPVLAWVVASLLMAYVCVDGTLYQWWTEELPPTLNRFIQEVMNGRRGG